MTNRRHDVVSIMLTDEREQLWPQVGLLALEDAETGQQVWVDSSSPQWQQYFVNRSNNIKHLRDAAMVDAQVDSIAISLGEDYVEPLLKFFQARNRRYRR